jgi:hypothetical protein
MVWMLAGDRRREHDARLEAADEPHELRACFGRVGYTRVG